MADHGGKRSGAGRPKGSTKKGTQLDEFNMMLRAQEHSAEMLDILLEIARDGKSEGTRLNAATQILDRAHGKPGQLKMPEPDDGLPDMKEIMLAYLANPLMNADAPLTGRMLFDDED